MLFWVVPKMSTSSVMILVNQCMTWFFLSILALVNGVSWETFSQSWSCPSAQLVRELSLPQFVVQSLRCKAKHLHQTIQELFGLHQVNHGNRCNHSVVGSVTHRVASLFISVLAPTFRGIPLDSPTLETGEAEPSPLPSGPSGPSWAVSPGSWGAAFL